MINVIDTVQDSGNGKWNEDGIIIIDDLICVLDGATPINNIKSGKYNTQAEWFVSSFIEKFKKIKKLGDKDLIGLTKELVNEIKGECKRNIANFNQPSFTFAGIQEDLGKLKAYALGDCSIYLELKTHEIKHISDDRIEKFSSRTQNSLIRAKKLGLDISQEVKKQITENREFMNVNNGYWVVGFSGDYGAHFIKEEILINCIDKVLICSDGFDRIFNVFNIISTNNIFAGTITLKEALKELRVYEEKHYNETNYRCVKKSDDATAILCEIKTENKN